MQRLPSSPSVWQCTHFSCSETGKRSKVQQIKKILFAQAHVGGGGEAMYDQRLFNQEGGMASGLAAEDTYNLYDKPLFADRGSNLYKARGGGVEDEAPVDEENARTFKPDKVRGHTVIVRPCSWQIRVLFNTCGLKVVSERGFNFPCIEWEGEHPQAREQLVYQS